MSVEAHKCNVRDCKGFIVFENADFDYNNLPTVDGMYEFDNPTCGECGKEYKVVPYHIVIAIDEHGDLEDVQSACITDYERRKNWLRVEKESDPYEKVKAYISYCRYSYEVEDIISSYKENWLNNHYVSHTTKDCIKQLEPELKLLVAMGY